MSAVRQNFVLPVQRVYDAVIRQRLPLKWGVYAGVPARDNRLLDTTDWKPNYKEGLLTAIEDHVTDGDTVVLIGGGRGVSSCYLAWAGADVVAHEAAQNMIEIAEETVEIQGLSDSVSFRHSIVGDPIDVFGSADGAAVIDPQELDAGDVLVLDCEGAEVSIISGLKDTPETIIVETHPECDAPTERVAELLADHGYDVTEREYEPGENGSKAVLVGTDLEN